MLAAKMADAWVDYMLQKQSGAQEKKCEQKELKMETEKQILEFTVPESLFPGDLAEAKKKFHELALYWHPDKTTGDAKVMSHITELYKEAVRLLETGNGEVLVFLI